MVSTPFTACRLQFRQVDLVQAQAKTLAQVVLLDIFTAGHFSAVEPGASRAEGIADTLLSRAHELILLRVGKFASFRRVQDQYRLLLHAKGPTSRQQFGARSSLLFLSWDAENAVQRSCYCVLQCTLHFRMSGIRQHVQTFTHIVIASTSLIQEEVNCMQKPGRVGVRLIGLTLLCSGSFRFRYFVQTFW